jgi:hypothetical protein
MFTRIVLRFLSLKFHLNKKNRFDFLYLPAKMLVEQILKLKAGKPAAGTKP